MSIWDVVLEMCVGGGMSKWIWWMKWGISSFDLDGMGGNAWGSDGCYWLAPVGASYSVAYALAAEYRAANDLD